MLYEDNPFRASVNVLATPHPIRAGEVAVIAIPDEVKEAEYKSVPLTVVTPELQVKPYEAPAPTVVAEARPLRRLPGTASHVPLFAALGLLSLGGAFGLRVLTNRAS